MLTGREHETAYKLANAQFSAGELKGVFSERPEMTDAIKRSIGDIVLDYCPRCDKMLRD